MRGDRPVEARLIRPPTEGLVGRRAALAGATGLFLGLMPPLGRAQVAPEATRARPQPGDVLVRVDLDKRGPLKVGDLSIGGDPILAWPLDPASDTVRSGSRLNKVLVLRLNPEGFDRQTHENESASPTRPKRSSSNARAISRITIRRPAPRCSAAHRRAVLPRCR